MSIKKTIFFIIPDLSHHGGAERVIFTILNSLDRKKYDLNLVVFERKGKLLDQLPKEVKVIDLNCKRIRYYLFYFIPLLVKVKPDLVFFGWGELGAYFSPFIKLFPKTKFIVRETNIVSQYIKRPEIRFFYRFYANFSTIIAQSEDMKRDLVKNIVVPEEKIQIINNPVDFIRIAKALDTKEKPDLPLFHKNVLAVGTLVHRKGFDELIKVFSHLKDKNIFLTILGEGKDRRFLESLARDLGVVNVKFKGIVDNPYIYYSKADLFVLSSRHEGFPNALLEAGACGLYALANNCKGGINEIIQKNTNGNVMDISKHEAFAVEIERLVNQKFDAQSIANAIETRYGKEIIMKEYVQLIKVNL